MVVVFLLGLALLALGVSLFFHDSMYYPESPLILLAIMVLVFGAVFTFFLPATTICRENKAIVYRPNNIYRDSTNEHVVVTYTEYSKIDKGASRSWVLDENAQFPISKFTDRKIATKTFENSDTAKLMLVSPDENIVVETHVGFNFFGWMIHGNTSIKVLSDHEANKYKLQ